MGAGGLALWILVGAVSVILVQSGLLAGLLIQRRRHRRVELALRESERHFRLMADTTPVMIWRSGVDAACYFFNKPWLDFRGRTLEQEEGSGWLDGVHSDDRESCVDTYVEAFEAREPYRMEYRLQRADGTYRWVLTTGVPRYDDASRFAGYIGSALDITDRKQVEEQNQELAGRLISVQEEERIRIARELHDDVSQQLAGVAIMLSGLKRQVGKRGSEPEIDGTVAILQERTATLAHTIRSLSHELHPGVLEHAGLVATLRRLCADIEQQHQLSVIFTAGDHLDALPPDVALCLFRVAQEALVNAVRHASARTIHVQLMATRGGTELRINDDGIGFVASERMGSGLGLRSIDERVRLVRGYVSMESRPGQGTNLLVTIPTAVAKPGTGHLVQLFDSDESLEDTVSAFVRGGLLQGDNVLVVMKARTWRSTGMRLVRTGVPVDDAIESGRLTVRAAEETLSSFMAEGRPDAVLFEQHVGSLVRDLASGGRLWVYGDMVDVLVADGNYSGAQLLEERWNELGEHATFTLLCGYSAAHLSQPEHADTLGEIYRVHSQVRSSHRDVAPPQHLV